MNDNNQPCGEKITINNEVYRVNLVENQNGYRVFASPCKLPSAVFEVAQICRQTNTCMQFDFYQAQIFTDPIVCIIDCSLCQIVCRAIEIYLSNSQSYLCNNSRNNVFGF